jgi:hypothetical protein
MASISSVHIALIALMTATLVNAGYINETFFCPLSKGVINGFDKAAFVRACDVNSTGFCGTCVCGLAVPLYNAFMKRGICANETDGVLSICESEYLYVLRQAKVLTEAVADGLKKCAKAGKTKCSKGREAWDTWYDRQCVVANPVTPDSTPTPSSAAYVSAVSCGLWLFVAVLVAVVV